MEHHSDIGQEVAHDGNIDDVEDGSLSAEIIAFLLRKRRAIMAGLGIGLLVGVMAAHIIPPKYTAEAILRPKDRMGKGGLLGSLAGLAGASGLLGLGSGSQSDFDAMTALLTSDELAARLMAKHPVIIQTIYHATWSPKTKQWHEHRTLEPIIDAIRAAIGMQPNPPITPRDLTKYLGHNLSITSDFKTGLLTLRFEAKDPVFARNFVNWAYTGADELVRQSAREASAKRIAYLNKQLPRVTQTDQHIALTRLLATEQQREMMVQADDCYSAVVVEYPIVPLKPSSPSVPLILIGFGLLGALGGAAQGYARERIGGRRDALSSSQDWSQHSGTIVRVD